MWRSDSNVYNNGEHVAKGLSVGSKFGYVLSLTVDNKMVDVGLSGDSNGKGAVSLHKLNLELNKWLCALPASWRRILSLAIGVVDCW